MAPISIEEFKEAHYSDVDWIVDYSVIDQPVLFIEIINGIIYDKWSVRFKTKIINEIEYFEIKGINILEFLHTIIPNTLSLDLELSTRQKNTLNEFKKIYKKLSSYYLEPHIPIIRFRKSIPEAITPTRRVIDAGYDLTIIRFEKKLTENTYLYDTGIQLIIPMGYYVEVFGRSSISKTGYTLANGTGIIDPGYLGSLKVALTKHDPSMPDIVLPNRIAQFILKPYTNSNLQEEDELSLHTNRGSGGFGSTNIV